jgi:hypothetical protein
MVLLQKELAYLRAKRLLNVTWAQPAAILCISRRPASVPLFIDYLSYKLRKHEKFAAQKVHLTELCYLLASAHPLLTHPHNPVPHSAASAGAPDAMSLASRLRQNMGDGSALLDISDPANASSSSSASTASTASTALTLCGGAPGSDRESLCGLATGLRQLELQRDLWVAQRRDSSSNNPSPLVSGSASVSAALPWPTSLMHVLAAEYLACADPRRLADKYTAALERCRECARALGRAADGLGGGGGACVCGYAVDAEAVLGYSNVGDFGAVVGGVFRYSSGGGDDDEDGGGAVAASEPISAGRSSRHDSTSASASSSSTSTSSSRHSSAPMPLPASVAPPVGVSLERELDGKEYSELRFSLQSFIRRFARDDGDLELLLQALEVHTLACINDCIAYIHQENAKNARDLDIFSRGQTMVPEAMLEPLLDITFGNLTPRIITRICHGLESPAFPASAWRSHDMWGAWKKVNFETVQICACEALVRVIDDERRRVERLARATAAAQAALIEKFKAEDKMAAEAGVVSESESEAEVEVITESSSWQDDDDDIDPELLDLLK